MIIKSMSRKEATFSQLVDYFEDGRQDERFTVYHNVYSNNPENIKSEFNKNATFLQKRKNGVYMYHEVLSITKSEKLPEEKQKEILKDIALNYIKSRAKNNLVYGVLHHDKKDNLHYHFMISSNELESDKKHRLSKEEFSKFKKDLELYVLEIYPELEQKKLINKEPGQQKDSGEKLSNKGVELKRRTGNTNQKDDVKERLRTVFAETKTKFEFFSAMEREQLEIYVHGNTIGVVDKTTDRKHRLKTLGMWDEFNVISERLEEIEKRKVQVDYAKNEFSKEKVDTRKIYEAPKPDNTSQSEPKQEPQQPKTEPDNIGKKYQTDKVDTRKARPEQKDQDEKQQPYSKSETTENRDFHDEEHKFDDKPDYRKPFEQFKYEADKERDEVLNQEKNKRDTIKKEFKKAGMGNKPPKGEELHNKTRDEQPRRTRNEESRQNRDEPEDRKEREIRKRKEEMRRSRDSEKNNSKDYSRDR